MPNSLDKLKTLSNKLQEKIEHKDVILGSEGQTSTLKKGTPDLIHVVKPATSVVISEDTVRDKNIIRVKALYEKLEINKKSPNFDTIFDYKAMNLSGIGLKEDDFGVIRKGKYIQIIAITYEADKNGKKKAKNISLGYFGKAEGLEIEKKNEIIEFVLRWRYEKAFQNLVHYRDLIAMVDVPQEDSLF